MIFPVILWSVARTYFDIITFELASAFKVHNVKDFKFEENYEPFIRKIYEPDSIADWKITKKLDRLSTHPKVARLIQIEIPDPAYRVKSDGNPISTVTEQIKRVIRQKYAFLKDHQDKPDTIIHMGDTHEHSKFITDVFDQFGTQLFKSLDVARFLETISDKTYALTKTDTPYMVPGFPKVYPVGKDLDVLVAPEDFYSVMAKLISFSRDYSQEFEIRDVSEPDGIRIRFHKKTPDKPLEYQIDVTSSNLVKKIDNSLGYNILTKDLEICSRLASLKKKPHKAHHADYIKKYKSEADKSLIKELLGEDLVRLYDSLVEE